MFYTFDKEETCNHNMHLTPFNNRPAIFYKYETSGEI